MKLKEQGKIRAIGASNVTADLIRGYCRYGQLDVIQEKYSLLTRRIEKQLLPTCRELGVSVQAYSPLEQGLLTGRVTMETTFPEGSTRNSNPSFQPARRKQALDLLTKWDDLTGKYDCTMAQLVIALTARMIPGAGAGQCRCTEYQTGWRGCRPHEVGRGCHFLSRCFRTKADNQKGTMPQKHRPFLVICAPSAGRGSHRLRWPPG